MSETLIIKNFGPIKDIELDLKKFNVLIGEQATGKSTVAKVLCMCRDFSYIINYSADEDSPYNGFFTSGLRQWGINDYVQEQTIITYSNESYKFEFKKGPPRYTITPISDEVKDLLGKSKQAEYKALATGYLAEEIYRFNVKNEKNSPFYFPTERGLQSLFSLGQEATSKLTNSLYKQLSKIHTASTMFTKETKIEPLDIYYKNINGEGWIRKKEEKSFHRLSNSASGYQSAIPIFLTIKYYTEIEEISKTFIVEEPEINLFPSTQKKLVEFFIENINENGHSFIIPTHSPYFLSSINDYLLAYKKGQENKNATARIIPQKYWLHPDDISCYQLKNGTAESIIDEKSGLINDNVIDEVSDDINDEFDRLLDVSDK